MPGRPKLLTRPPRTARLLPRPRLLAAAGDAPVVVLAAPEGSGCTSAAAQLAEQWPGRVAWCRLAPGWDTAGDVVAMVATGLGVELEPAQRPVALAEQLLDLFDAGPVTVVVDDLHLAGAGDLDRVLAECVDLLPADAHLVVAGAVRPAGLLGLLPPEQRVLLGPDQLAFDEREAEALFAAHGAGADAAARWREALDGWARGMAAGAQGPDGDPSRHLVALLDHLAQLDPTGGAVVDLAAAVTYVTPEVAAAADVTASRDLLADLAARSPVLDDHDGFVRMSSGASAARRATLDDGHVRRLRAAAGAAVAAEDPTTAIDLLLDAEEPEAAADVLAAHLSEIGVERALTWLYRLPAELRRRFPPVLAAGRATVHVDVALADAEQRVRAATTERQRREALLALGSVEAHHGELAAAATAYEAALRAARDDDVAAGRVTAELARTRWLLGDLVGARAALEDAPPGPAMTWLRAQLDVVEGRDPAPVHADDGEPATHAAAALVALAAGDDARAARHATSAWAAAVDVGGEALVAAAAVHGWSLLRLGEHDAAGLVARELERRLGPRHQLGRVHGAILRERCSRHAGDTAAHERDQRRLRDLRAQGYASSARLAALVLDRDDGSDGRPADLVVQVLGTHEVRCDGRVVRRADWRSKKALEVLTVLASHGPSGARREQVIEAVWPERPPEKGRTLLRTALSEVRRRLEPDRPAGEPARHLRTREDVLVVDLRLDLDVVEDLVAEDPVAALAALRAGLAPEVATAEWALPWAGRVRRLLLRAAAGVPDTAAFDDRAAALEALVEAEPWQRDHHLALAALHRAAGDDVAADAAERRWFDED